MEKNQNNAHVFATDCLLQGFVIKDSLYSFLPALGLSHETVAAQFMRQDQGGMYDLLEQVYYAMKRNFLENIMMQQSGKSVPVESVLFHEKFGWILESGIGKAYLGKVSVPKGLKITIGFMSYFSGDSIIRGEHPLEIGSFVSIANGAYISTTTHSHRTDFGATYNFRSNQRLVAEGMNLDVDTHPTDVNTGVIIGNDVWIGKDVTIMNGVTLGDGCVIGTKALVTKDCEPYGIYGGIPAKLIRYRFPPEVIAQMKAVQWWDWPYAKIRKNEKFFNTNFQEYKGSLKDLIVES